MKRIVALCLALFLMIGMLPVSALAENEPELAYRAAFSKDIAVDGKLDEADWRIYGKLSNGTPFGVLWDSKNLYIATAAAELAVAVNGISAQPAKSAYSDALELCFGLSDLGISLTGYSQAYALHLIAEDASWEGELYFTSLERDAVPNWNTKGASVKLWTAATDVSSVGSSAVTGGMRLYNRFVAPAVDNDNAAGARAYWIDTATKPWTTREGTVAVEMDVLVENMPQTEIRAHSYVHVFAAYGLNCAITDGNGDGITTAVTNTADGLYFVLYSESGGLRSQPTGKKVGEVFHLTQELTEDGTLRVYVDDVLIGSFTGALREQKKMASVAGKGYVSMNLWCDADHSLTEDGALDSDVTVTNVTFGRCKGETVLDTLSFADIRGSNQAADAVTSDLNLMKIWSNGQLENVPLSWTSSDPDAINPETGKVAPTGTYLDVTLTATVTGTQVSKDICVTVAPKSMESYFTDSMVTLDGTVSEQAWPGARSFNHASGSGTSGSVSAMWYQETAYFAVKHTGAATLKLELQGCEWTVDLSSGIVTGRALTAAKGSGTVELAVDLAAAGIKLLDYNQAYSFQITLTGTDGSAAIEAAPLQLIFVSREQVEEDFSGSGENYKNYVVRDSNNGLTFRGQHASDPEVLYAAGISAVSMNKDVLLEMDLNVQTMPVSTGAVANNWQADGLYLFLLDHNSSLYPSDAANQANYVAMGTVLYNTVDGLVLRVRVGASVTSCRDVPLGKKAGEGTFHLGLAWRNEPYQSSYKGYADVYVDGVLLQTVEWVNYNYKGSKDSVNLRYYEDEAASITVSNLTLTVESFASLADEIMPETLLGNADLSALKADLVLPKTFDSPFLGTLPLTWRSSCEEILSAEGKVNRPRGKAGKYADLTLYVGQKELWNQTAFIPGKDETPAVSAPVLGAGFTAEAPTVDGVLTDHGWNMNTALQKADGTRLGRFGAQWDTENLYLGIETGGLTPEITLGGKAISLEAATVADGILEIAVALQELGIEELDYGIEIPASVTLGAASWQGTLKLTSNDWFYTDSVEPRWGSPLVGSTRLGSDMPTVNQGVTRQSDGFRFFDRYDPNGNNPTLVRSYAILYGSSEESITLLRPLADRDVATYVEFDFQAEAMPLYSMNNLKDHNEYYASSGFCWLISGEQVENISDNVAFSILNTEDGLVLAARGTENHTVVLNRQVGDKLRIGVRWERSGDVTVFLDGAYLTEFLSVQMRRQGVGNTAFAMSLIRSAEPARSKNDNFEISISNIALGKSYGDSLLDALTFEIFCGENADPYEITADLQLPENLFNDQLTEPLEINWTSSDPSVLADDGIVAPGMKGKLAILTAEVRGKTKDFELYIPGTGTDLDVLIVENDKDTANGAGVAQDRYRYTLDRENNSVIYDQKESKVFNSVILTDSDAVSRLNESNLTVWVSEDNCTYSRVDSFKLLRSGKQIYLYDFEAKGRYVKVHCTVHTDHGADFTALLADMIRVSYESVFGANGGTFEERSATVSNDSARTLYDTVFAVAGEAQRVLLDGELLYHYTENGTTYVRIPVVKAGETVDLTLLSGNPAALDISNPEYVYEVVYGTREVIQRDEPRWIAGMPDGSMVGITTLTDVDGNVVMCYNFSYNKGLTWTELQPITCSVGYVQYAGGVGVDPDTGRIIAHCIGPKVTWNAEDHTLSDCKTWLFYSDDYGRTWTRSPEMAMDGKTAHYYLSYTDPTKLGTADGQDGPGVDFVLPFGVQSDKNDGSLVCRVAYSTDGGATWTMSASEISYTGNDQWHYEGGVSESTVLQQEDGTLVLYGRCQFGDVDFFARSYSYDHGITWVESAELSSIYTVNTQPLLHNFHGQHIMTWAGNTVLGGNSYKRYPLTVAASDDDGITFTHIQDLFSRTPLQNMERNNYSVTNQHVASSGDTVSLIWGHVLMRVDGFTDYIYRTKGAYDSFENSTVMAEGWSSTLGTVRLADSKASLGSRSMLLEDSAAAARSVPYLEMGRISLDLFVETAANMKLELEAAHGDIFGKAAPVALEIVDGEIGDTGLTLITGEWNRLVFDISMPEGKVTLNLNGESAQINLNGEVGQYICWIHLTTENTDIYVDRVIVEDLDPAEVPEKPAEPKIPAKPAVVMRSVSLKGNIGINYYMSIPADVLTDETAFMRFTMEDGAVCEVPVTDSSVEIIDGKAYYVFTCQVAAKEMNDRITAQFFYGDGNYTRKDEYCVTAYAYEVLEDTTGSYEAVKPMVEAMLHYGAAAQTYFGYKTEALANADLENKPDYSDITAQTLAPYAGTGSGDTLFFGSSLLLKGETSLRFFFRVAEGTEFTATYAGETMKSTFRDGLHYVTVENISAKDLDKAIAVTANGVEVTGSALTYAYHVLNAADGTYPETLVTLVKALYAYNRAANAYFGEY